MLLSSTRSWMTDTLVFCHLLQQRAARQLGLRAAPQSTQGAEEGFAIGTLMDLISDLQTFARNLPGELGF